VADEQTPVENVDDKTIIVTRSNFERCVAVWDRMRSEARDSADGAVWEGFTTALTRELGLSQGYYTQIVRALQDMKCMEQIKRGGGAGPSKWRLLKRPTDVDFEGREVLIPPGQSSRQLKINMQQQEIRDLNRRLSYVERELADIKEFLGMGGPYGSPRRTGFQPAGSFTNRPTDNGEAG
jgi:hypothetical protein